MSDQPKPPVDILDTTVDLTRVVDWVLENSPNSTPHELMEEVLSIVDQKLRGASRAFLRTEVLKQALCTVIVKHIDRHRNEFFEGSRAPSEWRGILSERMRGILRRYAFYGDATVVDLRAAQLRLRQSARQALIEINRNSRLEAALRDHPTAKRVSELPEDLLQLLFTGRKAGDP